MWVLGQPPIPEVCSGKIEAKKYGESSYSQQEPGMTRDFNPGSIDQVTGYPDTPLSPQRTK